MQASEQYRALPRVETLPTVNSFVVCNGFPGTVTRTRESGPDSTWLGNMVEVKLDRGLVCVDYHDLRYL